MMKAHNSYVALFGAAQDTGNLGVTALSQSIVLGLWSRKMRDTVVFDHGRGTRTTDLRAGGDIVTFRSQGAVGGLRLYRPESLTRAVAENRLGLSFNPIVRTVRQAAAVLDISGGDSFSDIYGKRRFVAVTQPKHLALDSGIPLLLMPQTYGPFEDRARRGEAADILQRSHLAFARDARSFRIMQELLGKRFDHARHQCGVDVAFALPISQPVETQRTNFLEWKARQPHQLAGFNISGLLFNEPRESMQRFGLKTDFRSLAMTFARRMLEETSASLLLMPHVLNRPGSMESDVLAASSVQAELSTRFGDRIFVPEVTSSATEAKWYISQCDWFTGGRMHATIAALSSGVPALALDYSGKMQGVFETCGQGHSVANLRDISSEGAVVETMLASLGDAGSNRALLADTLPRTLAIARDQMDRIVSHIQIAGTGAADLYGMDSSNAA